jgi:hypothetical protein
MHIMETQKVSQSFLVATTVLRSIKNNKHLANTFKRKIDLSNRALSSRKVFIKHVIGYIKRFKTITDKYKSRRKRFGSKFNLFAVFYNFELES